MKVVAQGKVKYKGKYYHEKMIFDHDNPEKAIEFGLVKLYETEDNRAEPIKEEVGIPTQKNGKKNRPTSRN